MILCRKGVGNRRASGRGSESFDDGLGKSLEPQTQGRPTIHIRQYCVYWTVAVLIRVSQPPDEVKHSRRKLAICFKPWSFRPSKATRDRIFPAAHPLVVGIEQGRRVDPVIVEMFDPALNARCFLDPWEHNTPDERHGSYREPQASPTRCLISSRHGATLLSE